MKIYLAGPMRGIPEFNFPAFDEAAARGRALGHSMVSPAELDRDHGFNEKGMDGKVDANGHNAVVTLDFMRGAAWRDFLAIVGPDPTTPGVDAIALLPGWEKSKGAAGELALAKWIGLKILDARTFKEMAVTTESRAVEKNGTTRYAGHLVPPDEVAALLAAQPGAVVAVSDVRAAPAVIPNGEFVVKDSGARTQFTTGAVRDAQDGKGFFHCIPFIAIEALAKLYEAGAKKYAKDNWKKGIPLSRFIDAIFRHAFKLSEGWRDEDHAAAVMWNAAGFIWTLDAMKRGALPAELNDIAFPMKAAA